MNATTSGLLFCLGISLGCASAATIDQTGLANGAADASAVDLNLPGMPLPGYAFPWTMNFFPENIPLSNPDSFDPGAIGGSFLITGNSSFDFTGDLQLSIFQLNPQGGMDTLQVTSSAQASPEPGSGYMLAGALCAMLACTGYVKLSAR